MIEKIIELSSDLTLSEIFGAYDCNASMIENQYGVRLEGARENGCSVRVTGLKEEDVRRAADTVSYLAELAENGQVIDERRLEYAMSMINEGQKDQLGEMDDSFICLSAKGKPIRPKTVGQKQYVELIRNNTVVFGAGPAGTGKTFLAVAMAASALRQKQVSRIVLTRPAVEAGERLGYLPGDLQSKIDPYLRPLYDALYEIIGAEAFSRNLEKGVIEIAPLAYMRGRTLDDSFIILDEAQNTTPEQMKMFLTRLGFNSKAIVTGDLTQTDLPHGVKSGLLDATKILSGIDDIAIHYFTERDVVRHRLVQKIILAYEKNARKEERKS